MIESGKFLSAATELGQRRELQRDQSGKQQRSFYEHDETCVVSRCFFFLAEESV